MTRAAVSDVLGQVVGNYHVLEKIGDGGMGAVYRARHVLTDLPAAIKVLHPHHLADQETTQRFFNEARAAMQIRHPGVIQMYDFGTHDDGSAYLVMEYLEGEDLSKRIRGGRRLPIATAMLIGRQVVQALEVAHKQGVIHRDLKPDNLFMTPDASVPGGERVKILDFGIAKVLDAPHGSLHKTQTGSVMGTPTYMSPEQCRGTGQIDHRTDLYALGCILFRLMCGRVVFRGKGYGELIAAHIHLPPPQPTSLEPSIPPLFEDIILKLLSKEADDRYQSAGALLDAMDEAVANTHLGLPAPGAAVPVKRRATTREDTQIFTPGASPRPEPTGEPGGTEMPSADNWVWPAQTRERDPRVSRPVSAPERGDPAGAREGDLDVRTRVRNTPEPTLHESEVEIGVDEYEDDDDEPRSGAPWLLWVAVAALIAAAGALGVLYYLGVLPP